MRELDRIAYVRNIWAAAFIYASGLRFVRATRFPGQGSRVTFCFADPDNIVPRLMEEFFDNEVLQTLIESRRLLGGVIDIARDRGECFPEDVASDLAMVRRSPRPRTSGECIGGEA